MNICVNNHVSAWSLFVSISSILYFGLMAVSGSLITVENGVYKRLTVRVNEDVCKCHCDQIIENVQVGIFKPIIRNRYSMVKIAYFDHLFRLSFVNITTKCWYHSVRWG